MRQNLWLREAWSEAKLKSGFRYLIMIFKGPPKFVLSGTANYDGTYDVDYLSETAFGGNHEVIITAPYVDETFTGGTLHRMFISIALPDHGFVVGDIVSIENDTNYNGTYRVITKEPNSFTIQAEFTTSTTSPTATIKKELRRLQTSTVSLGFKKGSSISIRNAGDYNGKYLVQDIAESVPGAGFDLFDIMIDKPVAPVAGGTARRVFITIPDNVTFIFPDNGFYLNFMPSIHVIWKAKIIATDEQHIFNMDDDELPFPDRAKLNFRSTGMVSHVLHWGCYSDT